MQIELVKIINGDIVFIFRLFHIKIDNKNYCVAEERLNTFIEQQIENNHYHIVENIDDRYNYFVLQEIADTENEEYILQSIKEVLYNNC